MQIKGRISKLEKTQREKTRGINGYYLVFDDPDRDKMEITHFTDLVYSGPVAAGNEVLKELDRPENTIIHMHVPREWAQ